MIKCIFHKENLNAIDTFMKNTFYLSQDQTNGVGEDFEK